MSAIIASNLSRAETEDLVVSLWIILERHKFSSPRIVTKTRLDLLGIEFHFRSQHELNIVMAELPAALAAKVDAKSKHLATGREAAAVA